MMHLPFYSLNEIKQFVDVQREASSTLRTQITHAALKDIIYYYSPVLHEDKELQCFFECMIFQNCVFLKKKPVNY
jgi:hypothetical protein